jgi:hypothetical protein
MGTDGARAGGAGAAPDTSGGGGSISGGSGGVGELPRRRRQRWSAERRAAFLDHLAASCNITDSAAAVGFSVGSAYQLRSSDPAFAAGWDEALASGYQVLETRLLGHALRGVAGEGPGEAAGGEHTVTNGAVRGMAPLTMDLGLRLLSFRASKLAGRGRERGAPPQRAGREELEKAILDKLDAIERHRGHE